jgi:hypothetical protein
MNSPCTHEPLTPAVQRCCDARNRMIEIDRRPLDPDYKDDDYPEIPKDDDLRSLSRYQVKTFTLLNDRDPSLAYRSLMPQPTTREAIQDYIACVLHGIAIEAIDEGTGTKLLYGAQIAIAALPKEAKEKRTDAPTPFFDTSRFR